jgi:hypothetical protein
MGQGSAPLSIGWGVNEVNQGCDINKYEKEIQGQPGIGIVLIPFFFNERDRFYR